MKANFASGCRDALLARTITYRRTSGFKIIIWVNVGPKSNYLNESFYFRILAGCNRTTSEGKQASLQSAFGDRQWQLQLNRTLASMDPQFVDQLTDRLYQAFASARDSACRS